MDNRDTFGEIISYLDLVDLRSFMFVCRQTLQWICASVCWREFCSGHILEAAELMSCDMIFQRMIGMDIGKRTIRNQPYYGEALKWFLIDRVFNSNFTISVYDLLNPVCYYNWKYLYLILSTTDLEKFFNYNRYSCHMVPETVPPEILRKLYIEQDSYRKGSIFYTERVCFDLIAEEILPISNNGWYYKRISFEATDDPVSNVIHEVAEKLGIRFEELVEIINNIYCLNEY